jgi:hypothetical protein
MSEQIAAKLDEARALIEKGWCQGSFYQNGCRCAYGAMLSTVKGERLRFDLLDGMRGQMAAVIDGPIFDWNDAPERTQAEVIEAFRKAAELARSGETA